jgi:hypothetical protein
MSCVTTQPEALSAAASGLTSIGSAMSVHNAAAAPMAGVVPAAADEVSALTAAVTILGVSAGCYAATEAANAAATR